MKRFFKSNSLSLILATCVIMQFMGRTVYANATSKAKNKVFKPTTIEWTFSSPDINTMTGTYTVKARSEAECKCDKDYDPAAFGTYKSDSNTWNVNDDLALKVISTDADVPHADSKAKASVWANKATPMGGNMYKLESHHILSAEANTKLCTVTSRAKGQSLSWVEIAGATAKKGQKKIVKVKKRSWTECSGKDKGKAQYKDPIGIILTEIGTDISYTEELFTLDVVTEFSNGCSSEAMYDWEDGVMLSTLLNSEGLMDATASIEGSADSIWLDAPYGEFGAYLEDGAFSASGVWEGLPWTFTYDGTYIVTASLSAAYLPTIFDYTIPESLFKDGYEYEESLFCHSTADASCETIPCPATLLLLGLGSVMLRKRRA